MYGYYEFKNNISTIGLIILKNIDHSDWLEPLTISALIVGLIFACGN